MKERPILFGAPMVRAILNGTKTQTRRPMRDQVVEPGIVRMARPGYCEIVNGHGISIPGFSCPYGQPGDRLWVREAWADLTETHGQRWEKLNPETRLYERGVHPFIWYRADGDQPDAGSGANNSEKWRPSIHMPRPASRITLEITGVRVERLHDISEDDAISEGVERTVTGDGWRRYCDADMEMAGVPPVATARQSYFTLWNQIHGHGTWTENPWVWVVEFKRMESQMD